ncbi:MAG TPA: trypsin-like peptidase domain-containing protein [Pirellulales bacterium]|jgi:serine protease Do|nr:trypsin-like peptidase domain-containing protein [Pirellulales bacterium]
MIRLAYQTLAPGDSPGAKGAVFSSVVMLLAIISAASAAEQVTVTLVGGAKITATLLRESDDGIVLDLGTEVLNLPTKRVLDIDRQAKAARRESKSDHGIFSTGRLEAADVPTLVKRFGDAVVMVKNAVGRGSGFIISKQGHLITNYHVVEGQTKLQVTLFRLTDQGYEKHELKKVKILALQPLRDLALLQLDTAELPGAMPAPVVIDDRDDLHVGDLIFAIGNPLGLERSVTQGIVSSTTRTIGHLRLIQTDASINPGNSGGPMFNARGEIVGVVCAGATSFDGLAFGIPATDLVDFLVHRETYLYDSAQPQNGVTYLAPPYRAKSEGDEAAKDNSPDDDASNPKDRQARKGENP